MNDPAIRSTTNDALYDLLSAEVFAALQDEALLRGATTEELARFLLKDWLGFDARLQEEIARSPEAVRDGPDGCGI